MMTTNVKLTQNQKLLLDLGPLFAFFAANWFFEIYWATAVLMGTTAIALGIKYYIKGRVSKFDLVSVAFVLVFGAAAIAFHDRKFLVAKVTVLEFLFATILIGGLRFEKIFLKEMMGDAIVMPNEAWATLTKRWAIFFVVIGVLNLFVYYFFDQYWVTFKAFGLLGLTMVFALANAPFMAKYIKE